MPEHGLQCLGAAAFVKVLRDGFVPFPPQESLDGDGHLLRAEGEAVGYIAPRLVLRLLLHW